MKFPISWMSLLVDFCPLFFSSFSVLHYSFFVFPCIPNTALYMAVDLAEELRNTLRTFLSWSRVWYRVFGTNKHVQCALGQHLPIISHLNPFLHLRIRFMIVP
jgi:hypothetical protein